MRVSFSFYWIRTHTNDFILIPKTPYLNIRFQLSTLEGHSSYSSNVVPSMNRFWYVNRDGMNHESNWAPYFPNMAEQT